MLAVSRVGHTDHQRVEDIGVALEGGLDLFGIDLLPAAVDRYRAAAQHRDGAVLLNLSVVARNGVAHAVDGLERLGGFLLVLVIADGDVALLGNQTPHTGAGLHLVAVLVQHDGAVIDGDARTTAVWRVFGDDAGPAEAGLRRPDGIGDDP